MDEQDLLHSATSCFVFNVLLPPTCCWGLVVVGLVVDARGIAPDASGLAVDLEDSSVFREESCWGILEDLFLVSAGAVSMVTIKIHKRCL